MISIYGLFDPQDGTLRYVGRTKMKLKRRLNAHISCAKNKGLNNHKDNWIREILSCGERPLIHELDQVENDRAQSEEYAWIQTFLEYGQPLTNAILAEKGDPFYPVMTDETRKKMSESHKWLMTQEERKQRSEFMKELWQDPEYQARVSSGLKRAYETTDFRKKVSEGCRGKKRSQETRKRMSEAQKLRYSDPEERKRISRMFQDPEISAKHKRSIRASWTAERRKAHSERMKKQWQNEEYREAQLSLLYKGRDRYNRENNNEN